MPLADAAVVTERALTYPEQARSLVIRDADSYQRAAEFLKGIKALRQEIADKLGPHIKRAYEAHRALLAEQRDAEGSLAEAERIVKNGLVAYEREQADRQAAEHQRLIAAAVAEEQERQLQQAIALESQGFAEQAAAVLSMPINAPMPTAPPVDIGKVAGISYRRTYSARCVSLIDLIKFVAEHPELVNLLKANESALNGMARSLKLSLNIPGVEVVSTRDVAASAKR